jgi:predicted CoA-binding protein
MKKTVVIGASSNVERYAYKATLSLAKHQHEVIPVGLRAGNIGNTTIKTEKEFITDVDTVTLYVGPQHQDSWIPYILSLHPKRVIFNPGTESTVHEQQLKNAGVAVEHACTLVLLATGTY